MIHSIFNMKITETPEQARENLERKVGHIYDEFKVLNGEAQDSLLKEGERTLRCKFKQFSFKVMNSKEVGLDFQLESLSFKVQSNSLFKTWSFRLSQVEGFQTRFKDFQSHSLSSNILTIISL